VNWARIRCVYRFIIPFSLVVICLLVLTGCKDIAFNNPLDPNASRDVLRIIRVMQTQLSGEGDICFDGEKLWKIDLMGNLSAIDRESGVIIRSFSAVGGTGVGFLYDRVYICNGERENLLYTIDPLSGDVLERYSTQNLYPLLITQAGGNLLLFDLRSEGIFQYTPETGQAQRLFELSGITPGGMAVYRDGLLVTDKTTDIVYYFALNGDVRDVFSSPATGIGGIAVDSSNYIYLFMLDGNIYKVSLP